MSGLESLLRAEGVRQVLLESGVNNESARAFFDGRGYSPLGITMHKGLVP